MTSLAVAVNQKNCRLSVQLLHFWAAEGPDHHFWMAANFAQADAQTGPKRKFLPMQAAHITRPQAKCDSQIDALSALFPAIEREQI